MNIAQRGLVFIIRIYQLTISPALAAALGPPARCRFTPSCSEYAREAIRLHGAIRGGCLAARRLGRCHPWGEAWHSQPATQFSPRSARSDIRQTPSNPRSIWSRLDRVPPHRVNMEGGTLSWIVNPSSSWVLPCCYCWVCRPSLTICFRRNRRPPGSRP